jgi:hypothetical protein
MLILILIIASPNNPLSISCYGKIYIIANVATGKPKNREQNRSGFYNMPINYFFSSFSLPLLFPPILPIPESFQMDFAYYI